MKYRLQSRCHCKVTIIIFWVKIKICAILVKFYSLYDILFVYNFIRLYDILQHFDFR